MLMKALRFMVHVTLSASILLCCCFPEAAQALRFSEISHVYFFGDSLTDSGFNDLWPTQGNPPFVPPLPTGKAPTFTTFGGYTWAQFIARDIKGLTLPVFPGPTPPDIITNNSFYAAPPHVPGFVSGELIGTNYAAGGSTTNSIGVAEVWAPSLHQQIGQYLGTVGRADPNAVYFIWSGANDILAVLESAPPLPTQLQLLTAVNIAANNIANEVALLSARGAKRIVVLSLPNIGFTPLIHQLSIAFNQPTLPASMKTLTFTFNSMLNSQLGHVIAKYHTKVLYVDVYDLLDAVIAATNAGQPYVVGGQSFKFVNSTDAACSTVPSAIYCPSTAPNNYVFADSIHPSSMAHRVLSLEVEILMRKWK